MSSGFVYRDEDKRKDQEEEEEGRNSKPPPVEEEMIEIRITPAVTKKQPAINSRVNPPDFDIEDEEIEIGGGSSE